MNTSLLDDFKEEALTWFSQWPDGLIAVNSDDSVIFLSPSASSVLGWDVGEAEGQKLHDLLCVQSRGYAHPAEECPLCNIKKKTESPLVQSSVWLNKSGHNIGIDYRVISLSSGVVDRVISFQNNLESQHSQGELEKYAEYVDKNPAPIAEFDGDGQMIFGNSAMHEQLLKKGFNEFGVARIFPGNLKSLCQESWKKRKIIRHIDVQIEASWYRWHLHPMDSEDSISVMGYAFNITDQKQVEQRIEREKAEIRRDFFAKMVHELRTPLNAIIGFSQILLRRTDGVIAERDTSNLRSIRAAGLQLNEMISDTLDISKIDAGKMSLDIESFKLIRVFESFQDQLQSLAEAKGLEYSVHCDRAIELESDIKKVRQIIINLISNAIKYTVNGGVSIRVFECDHMNAGKAVQVDISDTGIGIPEDQVGTLFQSYQQVSENKNKGIQGTGLGLALVSELVQMLEGHIELVSQQDKGSTFSVIFPIKP